MSPAAREHVDLPRVELAPELGEPHPKLRDEIEGEAVAARRDRSPHLRLDGDALAGRDERQARPFAVPDDRVVAQVEPVVGEEHRVAPRDSARVLELHPGDRDGPRMRLGKRPVAPGDSERPLHGPLV